MRVILASLFVVGGVFGAVALLGERGAFERASPVVLGLGLAVFMLFLCVVAMILFHPVGANLFRRLTPEERLRELEQRGLLESSEFRARRAFAVAEIEDEGSHYFIELVDGRVLYLSGQYLYDYEPIGDDTGPEQPRRFPCTDFTVHRHATEGYVVEIECRGAVIEPELIARPFTDRDWKAGRVPDDGQIISDTTYDALKAWMSE